MPLRLAASKRIIGGMSTSSKFLTRIPCVAIALPSAYKTNREITQGILRYANERGPWAVQIVEGRMDEMHLAQVNRENYDGFFGNISSPRILKDILDSRLAVVLLDTFLPELLPCIRRRPLTCQLNSDDQPIGVAAARYFLERRFTHFAFVGDIHAASWSENRCRAFANTVSGAGLPCAVYPTPSAALLRNATREQMALGEWLRALPRPCAVFVSNDIRARNVLNACMNVGLAVPQDVAVLSCDNDELVCETTVPTLSSIQFNTQQAGYRAAALLDRMIRNRERISTSERVLHYGFQNIVTRNSSEAMQQPDPLVTRILTYIRLNAETRFTMTDLANALNVSRRLLEIRFRRTTGRTLHDELIRVRMERARMLLRAGTQSIEAIAAICGFSTPSHFGATFSKMFGCSPSAFRRQH